MTDFTRHDVADHLSEWQRLTNHIEELRRERDDDREIIGLIARERDDLRGEVDALKLRLARALEAERMAYGRNRARDWRGALVNLWWALKQGGMNQ
jgi:hypothetical protein